MSLQVSESTNFQLPNRPVTECFGSVSEIKNSPEFAPTSSAQVVLSAKLFRKKPAFFQGNGFLCQISPHDPGMLFALDISIGWFSAIGCLSNSGNNPSAGKDHCSHSVSGQKFYFRKPIHSFPVTWTSHLVPHRQIGLLVFAPAVSVIHLDICNSHVPKRGLLGEPVTC